jgi:quinol monooxygenase YgiN
MPVPVLIGFAGVLVAAVTTGMLAGLCVRRPRLCFILCTAATLGLTVALAAQSMGFADGFGPATFLAIQLSALLLVPLWLAWGLVEMAAGEVARFGMRLASGALTIVAGVIVATDPLTPAPFSKSWPLTGPHSQPVSAYALDAVQAVAVVTAVLTAGLAARRAKGGPRFRDTLTGTGPIALAVLGAAALRLSFPAAAKSVYPLLSMTAAALVWFGVTRAQDLRGEPDPGRAGEHQPAGRHGSGFPQGRYPAEGRAEGRRGPGNPGYPGGAGRGGQPGEARPPAPPPAVPPAQTSRPYGRISIFTLLEDKVAEFDRLAEQAAEEVSAGEPDTLVYVIHLVPDAPLQRIFYEIYRDRSAFESQESKPYMKRFVAERRSCVLATTVIELRLKYAKLAPLPSQHGAGQVPPHPQPHSHPQPPPRAPLPSGPPGPPGPVPSPPLQPLPQGPRQPRIPGPPPGSADQRRPPPSGGRRHEM